MGWRPARSLTVLHNQLKGGTRAAPPATDVNAWGLWGHPGTDSDHVPKDFPGLGNDVVTACDFPHAPALGLDARATLDAIRRSRDPRVKYGISSGQMFSSYAAHGYPPYTWRPYGGSDGHFTHGHLSVVGDARADGIQPWAIEIGDDMSVRASQLIEGLDIGLLKLPDGTPNNLVVRQIGLEKWQASVTATLNTLAAKVGAPVQVTLEPGQLSTLAALVAEHVVDADDNPLGADDLPAITAGTEAALRKVLGGLDAA